MSFVKSDEFSQKRTNKGPMSPRPRIATACRQWGAVGAARLCGPLDLESRFALAGGRFQLKNLDHTQEHISYAPVIQGSVSLGLHK